MIESEQISVFLSGMLRSLGALSLLPFGMDMSAQSLRMILAFIFGCWLSQGGSQYGGGSSYTLGVEFLIGIFIGLPLALAPQVAAMCGELFDLGRGQSIGSLYDPLTQSNETFLALIARQFLWASLLFVGAGEQLAFALKQSTLAFPLGICGSQTVSVLLYDSLPTRALELSIGLLRSGFMIFIPIVSLFLVIDVTFAFCSKVLPQVNFQNEAFLLKSVFGISALLIPSQLGLFESFQALTLQALKFP